MKNAINKIHNVAVVARDVLTLATVREVLRSQEFDNALDIASKKFTALRNTQKREYSAFYKHVLQEKFLMDKYYTHQRKTICKAFFAQVKAIYNDKKQEQNNTKNACQDQVVTVLDY